jgi:uncharacterized integral membrane protein
LGFVRVLEYVVASVLLIALVVFAVSNRSPVELNLFPFPFLLELPVYLALIAALVIGAVLGALVRYGSNLRIRLALRSLARQRKVMEGQPSSSKNTKTSFQPPEPEV